MKQKDHNLRQWVAFYVCVLLTFILKMTGNFCPVWGGTILGFFTTFVVGNYKHRKCKSNKEIALVGQSNGQALDEE